MSQLVQEVQKTHTTSGRAARQGRCRPAARSPAIFLVGVLLLTGGGSSSQEKEDEPGLPDLLRKLDQVATLYRDRALLFTCDETVDYSSAHGRKLVREYDYVYVHDDEGRLRDYRVLRKRRHKKRSRPVDLKKSGLPSYVLRAYSSVLLFESATQQRYRYRILDQEEVLGRPAIRVGLEPRPPVVEAVNDWHGTAWIDLDTGQLLRFEGLKWEDYSRKLRFEYELERWADHEQGHGPPRSVEIRQVATEFAVEKNGMRFPSEVLITATRLEPHAVTGSGRYRELPVFTVRQRYERYRFYDVQSIERINQIVVTDGETN